MKKPLRSPRFSPPRARKLFGRGRTLHALVSDNPLSQDLGLGGFDAKGDCTMKVLRSELGPDRPKLGEKVEFQGLSYRITRVTDHPQFPMIVLVVEPED